MSIVESAYIFLLMLGALAYLRKHLVGLTERRSQLALVRWTRAESAFWRELTLSRVDGARSALDRVRVIATEAETVAQIRARSATPERASFFWREVRVREMEDALAGAERRAQAWKA
ncbi:MAG: hypothetical protein KY464_14990 [Gemmatimonadetes bacterium]|nr:hypothetical protein [Gemmatimonadota bacterium]